MASWLLHGLVPLHGTWGTIANVLAFLALLAACLGLVLLFEDDPPLGRKLVWGLAIVVVPFVGPGLYLSRRGGDVGKGDP